ncbi:D-3-phosphoglycerate dehydrogenase [Desulfitispora alkaliphila]|uniref:phosphoglycerate dehydrogenase n=1 Tax=Desulfitispora alkaliphila TaxID=622674 RepID=UPI003D24C269
MFKVLVADPISEKGINILKENENVQVDVKLKLAEDEIASIIEDYQAIIVRSGVKVTRKIIENASNLKIIARAGVGVDNIDLEAATENGVVVVNAPEGNTIAAAEHTIAMITGIARNVPQAHAELRQGKWERKKYMGVELRDKVLGVVGLGKIGTEVIKRAIALEMRILGYDPFISEEMASKLGIELADLETIYKEADIITMHVPKTDKTKHMLGAEQFEMMKPTTYIVNVARGGIIDEEALYEAIKNNKIAGAALDVFESEPATDSPLFEFNSVVVTPHLGASTEEAQVNVAIDVAKDVKRVIEGKFVKNPVNIPAVKNEYKDVLNPYLELMEKMGKICSKLGEGRLNKIEVKYSGELANYDTTSLTNTCLKGLLRPTLGDEVNYVNAPYIAKNRDIKVKESKTSEIEKYANLVRLELTTDAGVRSVEGTIFKQGEFRIVAIDGYSIDVDPKGHLLIVPHTDKPGIIGLVGTYLGEDNINIAGMQVGRKELGGIAVMVLAVDEAVSEETIEKINKIEAVVDVKYVKL